jgi:hypothetical protein
MDLGNITEVSEVSQEAQNVLSKQRKGKNSKFPKLSENDLSREEHITRFPHANDSSNEVTD